MGIFRQFNKFDYALNKNFKEFIEIDNIYENEKYYRTFFYNDVIFNPRITIQDSGVLEIRYETKQMFEISTPVLVLDILKKIGARINDWDMSKIKNLKDVNGEYRFEEREDFGFWKRLWNKLLKKPNTKSWWFIPLGRNGTTLLFEKERKHQYMVIKNWNKIVPLRDL